MTLPATGEWYCSRGVEVCNHCELPIRMNHAHLRYKRPCDEQWERICAKCLDAWQNWEEFEVVQTYRKLRQKEIREEFEDWTPSDPDYCPVIRPSPPIPHMIHTRRK